MKTKHVIFLICIFISFYTNIDASVVIPEIARCSSKLGRSINFAKQEELETSMQCLKRKDSPKKDISKITEIRLTQAGTLQTILGGDMDVINKIQALKITGPLNGADIKLISNIPTMEYLDLENAQIVSGGGPYYEEFYTDDNVIGSFMFNSMYYLSTLILPTSTTKIEPTSLSYCMRMNNYEISKDNKNYTSIDGAIYTKDTTTLIAYPGLRSDTAVINDRVTTIGSCAMAGCIYLKGVKFGTRINEIESFAFEYCSSLTSVFIPESVDDIGTKAFNMCKRLEYVHIPKTTNYIGDYAFNCCSNMKEFNVDKNSRSFLSLQGVLFGIKGGIVTLISFPNMKTDSYNLPPFVVKVGNGAFAWTRLKSITFNAGLSYIEDFAFNHCDSLKNIYDLNTKDHPDDNDRAPFDKSAFDSVYVHICSIGNGIGIWSHFKNVVKDTSITKGCPPKISCSKSYASIYPDKKDSYLCYGPDGKDCCIFCCDSICISFENTIEITKCNIYDRGCAIVNLLNSDEDDFNHTMLRNHTISAFEYDPGKLPSDTISMLVPNSYKLIEPGTLASTIGDYYKNITDLTIEGPINGTDITSIKNMHLSYLDLEKASIVEGGDSIASHYVLFNTGTLGDYFKMKKDTIIYGMFDHSSLNEFHVPDNLSMIEPDAFYHTKIKKFVAGKDNLRYSSANGILYDKQQKILVMYPFIGWLNDFKKIPETVEEISDNATTNCEIDTLEISKNVRKIGNGPLGTYHIKLDKNNPYFSVAHDCLFNKDGSSIYAYKNNIANSDSLQMILGSVKCIKNGAVVLMGSVQMKNLDALDSICPNAFWYAEDLLDSASISIPSNLRYIGPMSLCNFNKINIDNSNKYFSYKDETLYNKDGTKLIYSKYTRDYSLVIPETVDTISAYAIFGLPVTNIEIPSSVNYIGENAMCYLPKLKNIKCDGPIPPSVGKYGLYYYYNSATLTVPKGSIELYRRAPYWSLFKHIVEEESDGIKNPISNHANITEIARYDIQGRSIHVPEKGINIIKMSDGSVRKVLVK